MLQHNFDFKGGVLPVPNGGTCKFLMFLLNGTKEVSVSQAVKYGFAEHRPAESLDRWSAVAYQTSLPVVKIFLQEMAGFGKEKFTQTFFLALGKKLEKQVVTIQPRMALARSAGFKFSAEASFLKKSEALALLEPDSISAKILSVQHQPPLAVLKEIVQIERLGAPKELKISSHGGIRKLRVN